RVLRLPANCATPAAQVASASAGSGRYVVRRGDSLSAIAVAHHTTARTLARLNGMRVSGVLVEGRVLRLPTHGPASGTATGAIAGSGRYVVRVGDTLSGIAARAGTSLASLASVNHLRSTGVLLTGTILRLPSGSHAPHVATSHATATSHASVADSI